MTSTPASAGPFPFVRLLSIRCTPYLARLPLTPNHITLLSIAFGLAAAAAILWGARYGSVLGAALLIVSYVLDNCDGEIARLKRMSSRFGAKLDDFGDWLVHTLLFVAMGLAASRARMDSVWLWLGVAASVGGTVNYLASMWPNPPDIAAEAPLGEASALPATPLEWIAFVFRELMRADFCFIVMVLAVFDSLWWLLPAAAIGAQVYWMLRMVQAASPIPRLTKAAAAAGSVTLRYVKIAFLVAGIGLFLHLLREVDGAAVVDLIAEAQWWLALIAAIYFIAFVIDTVTWQLTLHPLPRDLRWLYRLWKVRMAGEALNEALPLGGFGGEPMKLLVATRTYGLEGRHVTASLILARTINTLALILFLGIGFAFVLHAPQLPDTTKWAAGIGLGTLTAGVLGFFALQRYGVATRLVRLLDGAALANRVAAVLEHVREVDGRLETFYRRDWPRFAAAMAGALANWILGALETFVILWVIGYPVTFMDAWIIEAATQLARAGAFFVPAAIGVQEGAFVLICGLLTGSPAAGLATALIRRLRQIVWMAWGLIIAAGFRRRSEVAARAAEPPSGLTVKIPDRAA